ncbi:MAG: hypothetical protein EZS28_003765 [Streblomastix strix]|uniref:Uncharacterized protein n=1 Tax=Streblomastix strix TaxID=222440 RepID=A0A5J4X1T6_9EUKA|nr:MAG: hypothetical protein EZS28_003765 [Streblomastix strix]
MIRYSYPNNLIQLVQIPNFVSIVTSGSGTAGGSEEEQYIVIYYSLMTIIYFYKRYQENNFDPQRTILKPFEEEIEESGQIEEAEAQMFISRKYYNENGTVISDKALECMREIINAYIDDTNLPVWMRHRH